MILVRNLKNYQPGVFILVIFIGLLSWMKVFVSKDMPGAFIDPHPMPIYNWIYSIIGDFSFLSKFIAFVLVIIQAILFNGITNYYNLLGHRSYFPGLFFMLITANFPSLQTLHPLLFANLFFIIAWERIAGVTENANNFTVYFNAALLLGISTLFYPNYVFCLLIIILSTGMNRISHSREYVLIFTGFLAVWYFYFTLYYIFVSKIQLTGIQFDISFQRTGFKMFSASQYIFLGYVALILFFASLQLASNISNMKIIVRRNLKLLFAWFVLGLIVLFYTNSSLEFAYVIAIPVSILLSFFFLTIKNKWISEIVWIIFLAFCIINQFFPDLI